MKVNYEKNKHLQTSILLLITFSHQEVLEVQEISYSYKNEVTNDETYLSVQLLICDRK